MSPGPTFDRVYVALKEQLMSGRFAPGEHLEPSAIGEELHSSITPVRDALHRLVGEKMVEAPRNDGFRVPSPTEAELRDLYRWNCEMLELALRRRASGAGVVLPGRSKDGAGAASWAVADLFRFIARRTGNPEHETAVENVSDRLASLRLIEGSLFGDSAEELAGMLGLFADPDVAALRRAIIAYHRRRQRRVPDLLVSLRRAHLDP